MSRFQRAPTMAIVLDHGDRLRPGHRFPPRSSETRRRQFRPGFFDRSDDLPLGLDFVASREQRRIAAHRVEQQRFIGRGSRRYQRRRCRRNPCSPEWPASAVPGVLAPKLMRDTFIRLNAHGDDVVVNVSRTAGEQRLRRALKVHRNFGQTGSPAVFRRERRRELPPSASCRHGTRPQHRSRWSTWD